MDEIVSIEFVKSAETTSDIMNKNQLSIYFKSAQSKLVYTIEDMEKERRKFKIIELEGC